MSPISVSAIRLSFARISGFGENFDVIDAEALQVLDVFAADRRQIAGRGGDTQGVDAHLQHPDHLIGAVLAAAHGYDAVPIAACLPVLVDDGEQLHLARVPIDVLAVLVSAARVAYTLRIDVQIRLGGWHDASDTVFQHEIKAFTVSWSKV